MNHDGVQTKFTESMTPPLVPIFTKHIFHNYHICFGFKHDKIWETTKLHLYFLDKSIKD